MSISYYQWLVEKQYVRQTEARRGQKRADRQVVSPVYGPIANAPLLVAEPFRWNMTQAPQLGDLLDGESEDVFPGFDTELLRTASHVLASAGDADLIFLGRSPESLFDLMTGLLKGTSWEQRLVLLPYSAGSRWSADTKEATPEALAAYHSYLESVDLSPRRLADTNRRPVAFVDIVASGNTFHRLTCLLQHFARESRTDWRAVQRKIRFVGLCRQEKTSPNIWRWQQHSHWLKELCPDAIVRNVSVDYQLYHYLADRQLKTTRSHIPERWEQPNRASDLRDHRILRALRLARSIFEMGEKRSIRRKFAALLVNERAMCFRWFRDLVGEVKAIASSDN